MCTLNCQLLEVIEGQSGEQGIEYCLLAGIQTQCKGDTLRCERMESIRDYVLRRIDEMNQA